MPPGNYKLTFTMPGFATEQRDFAVRLMQLSIIDVTMKDATFEGEIVVTSENPTIDTESAEIKSSTSDAVIQALPVGQQYRDLIKLIPGVQYTEDTIRGPSAGGSGQDNVYEFDGVNVNLPMFGTLSTEPSNHDIEEMTAVKGGANAVGFNRSGGLLVNTLSKSGTNQFKGEVSYQIQTDSMTGDITADTESTGDPDRDWAVANLGGPIIKEMLYFFASYYRPTSTLENRANAYGEVPQYESVRDEWFGKLSFNPVDSFLMSVSYRDSKTDESGRSVGEFEAGSTAVRRRCRPDDRDRRGNLDGHRQQLHLVQGLRLRERGLVDPGHRLRHRDLGQLDARRRQPRPDGLLQRAHTDRRSGRVQRLHRPDHPAVRL